MNEEKEITEELFEERPVEDLETVPYSVENPPWGIFSALGLWIFSVLTIVMFGAFAVLAYSEYSGASLEAIATFSDAGGVDVQLLSTAPAHLLTLVLAYMIATGFNKADWRDTLGMEWGGFRWWHTIVFLLAFLALGAGLTQIFEQTDNMIEKAINASPNALFIIALLATFSAPVVEEVVYRGILYGAIDKAGGTIAAITIVTLLFALVHVPQYAGDWSVIIMLVGLSLAITIIRTYTKNLWPCIFIHFVFNGLQSIGLIAQKYVPGIDG